MTLRQRAAAEIAEEIARVMAAVPGHATGTSASAAAHVIHTVSAVTRRSLKLLSAHRYYVTFALVIAATIYVTEQVLASGVLVDFDYYVHYLRLDQRYPSVYTPIFYLVMIGQRGPTAIPAFIVAAVLAWRRRSWRPVLMLGLSLLVLNLVVGAGKVWTARLKPSDNSTALFSGGIIFPSGHASNVVVTWGIAAYLLVRYGPLRKYRIGVIVTTIATLVVGLSSIYLDTHWVTDILAGWLIGVAIVMASVWADHRYPARIGRPSVSKADRRSAGEPVAVPDSAAALEQPVIPATRR